MFVSRTIVSNEEPPCKFGSDLASDLQFKSFRAKANDKILRKAGCIAPAKLFVSSTNFLSAASQTCVGFIDKWREADGFIANIYPRFGARRKY